MKKIVKIIIAFIIITAVAIGVYFIVDANMNKNLSYENVYSLNNSILTAEKENMYTIVNEQIDDMTKVLQNRTEDKYQTILNDFQTYLFVKDSYSVIEQEILQNGGLGLKRVNHYGKQATKDYNVLKKFYKKLYEKLCQNYLNVTEQTKEDVKLTYIYGFHQEFVGLTLAYNNFFYNTSFAYANGIDSTMDLNSLYKLEIEYYSSLINVYANNLIENQRCSQLFERSVVQNEQTKVTVKYDDCNPFGMIAGDFGAIENLKTHTTKTASETTIQEFNSLSDLFATFMSNFDIPTDGTEYVPTVSETALNSYTQFYNKAVELYNNSLLAFTTTAVKDVTKSALIGVNHPYVMTFGTELDLQSINLQTVVANLFGFTSEADFKTYAQQLANTYAEHKTNITNAENVNEALNNGCFYTNNGSFVFPIASKNSISTVLTYVIVDANGHVSVWVNDISSLLWSTNFNENYHTEGIVNNELYCKNILFVTELNTTNCKSTIQTYKNNIALDHANQYLLNKDILDDLFNKSLKLDLNTIAKNIVENKFEQSLISITDETVKDRLINFKNLVARG